MDQSSFCWVPGAAAAAAPKGWTGTDSLAQSLTSGAGASPAHGSGGGASSFCTMARSWASFSSFSTSSGSL